MHQAAPSGAFLRQNPLAYYGFGASDWQQTRRLRGTEPLVAPEPLLLGKKYAAYPQVRAVYFVIPVYDAKSNCINNGVMISNH